MNAATGQRTIRKEAALSGFGLLGGRDVRVRFAPAPPDSGVVFVRTDLAGPLRIPAHVDYVAPAVRRTVLERNGARVEMIEHVMAALAGLEIDNCEVHLDAPELPGCDGSSEAFVEKLLEAGIVGQAAPRRRLRIRRPVCVADGDAILAAHPAAGGRFIVSYDLEYGAGDGPIGRQSLFTEITPESFRQGLARSRTFLLEEEARELRSQGLGLRATTRDALVFGPDGPIDNTLRWADECVRHKILDLVGDLRLLGCAVEGYVVAHKSGHRLNAALVRELLKTHAIEQEAASAA